MKRGLLKAHYYLSGWSALLPRADLPDQKSSFIAETHFPEGVCVNIGEMTV